MPPFTPLPGSFPFLKVFEGFLKEYARCNTYWYVQKARVVNDENVKILCAITRIIFDEFLNRVWNHETQDALLLRLIEKGILDPYKKDSDLQDRTALVRIIKQLLVGLGILWVQKDKEIIITDAGLEVITAKNPRPTIEGQISKIQYPNPSLDLPYANEFGGLLPHLFLLQVLRKLKYQIAREEYELFVNLAQQQDDVERITSYINHWRELSDEEKVRLLETVKQRRPTRERYVTVHGSAPYQIPFFCYPQYLHYDDSEMLITCTSPESIDAMVDQKLKSLKIPSFDAEEDWFAYFGDPKQQPSWFTYLSLTVEQTTSPKEAAKIIKKHQEALTEEETEEIERMEIEKGIESFFVERLGMIEKGLVLVKNGRQYSTPIGRMDLLCKSKDGEFVVIEIKANEAEDSAFGQILRYIGWVHRNLEGGENNVRGVLLAGKFPDTARYSRIGLLKDNCNEFLRFKEHGLHVQDV
jgi:hypothetical protein